MSYREGAERFYDLFGAKDDAPFYIELAHAHGDKALELGVGTARLAIQLARAGVETWGIDNSTHMLRAAEAKLWEEPPEVRSRIHLELADARRFSLDECFGLVYFPSGSFDHILHREDQLLALRNIKKHLADDGVYAFDLAHAPELKKDSGWFVQKKPLDPNRQVVRTGYHTTDPVNRRMTLNLWYELYHDGRMLERYFETGDVYAHTPEGIRGLLDETGYEIEAEYGGHDRSPFTSESRSLVIVARIRT
jgi:SAM-dependent methyltransferase